MRTLNKAKRVITIMLALALVFTLTPAIPGAVENAYAAEPGISITGSTADSSGTGWSYVKSTKTLTLNNYSGGYIQGSGLNTLNLVLKGTSTITVDGTNAKGIALGNNQNLNISGSGSGSLTIKATGGSNLIYGIECNEFTMTSGTVTINANSSRMVYGVNANSSLSVTGGKLTTNITGTSDGRGLYCKTGKLTVGSGAEVAVKVTNKGSNDMYGIYNEAYTASVPDNGDIELAGTVTITRDGDSTGSGNVYGIANGSSNRKTDGVISITGGSVTVTNAYYGIIAFTKGHDAAFADVDISDGTVNVTSTTSDSLGIVSWNNGVTISGGTVTANTANKALWLVDSDSDNKTGLVKITGDAKVSLTSTDYKALIVQGDELNTSTRVHQINLTSGGSVTVKSTSSEESYYAFPVQGYFNLGSSTKITEGSFRSTADGTNTGGGKLFQSDNSTKRLVVAYGTLYTGAGAVSVNGHSFASDKLYYKNGGAGTTDDSTDYNAHYDPATGVLELKDYNSGPIIIGGSNAYDVTIKLTGTNTVTTSAPKEGVGNVCIGINITNADNVTFIGDGTLTVDTNAGSGLTQVFGIWLDRSAAAAENLTFQSGKVTVNVTATDTAAQVFGVSTVNSTGGMGGPITVAEGAELNVTLSSASIGLANGLRSKGDITLNGKTAITLTYTGSGSPNASNWTSVSGFSGDNKLNVGANAAITVDMPNTYGLTNGMGPAYYAAKSDSQIGGDWTSATESEQYFENDSFLVTQSIKSGYGYADYKYEVITPLTFEDKADYDIPAGTKDDSYTATVALTATGGSGGYRYEFEGTKPSDLSINAENKLFYTRSSLCDATTAIVKVTDKGGISKTITIDIGAVTEASPGTGTVPHIDNKTVSVGTAVTVPWPVGATAYQRFEGLTFDASGDRSGYPTGMYIPAQSTAVTKTYKFKVSFPGGWVESNEFTVTWTNTPIPAATVGDVTVSGTTGTAIAATEVNITLTNDKFNAIDTDTNVTSWFTNLPNGLEAKVKTAVNANDTTATITISGTPTVASDAVMQIKLPAANLVSSAELNVTANANAKFNISAPTYSVTINAGANMTLASGSANQSGLSGAMTDTVYTAADGYYFPTDYSSVGTSDGVTVTCDSYTQITVSGTPTANTTITLDPATAKTKEATPSAAFTADSENGGKLTGVDNTMKYSVNGGSNWLDIAGDNMAITNVTTSNGVKVKKPASDPDTKLDSDILTIDITKAAKPTGVTGVACTTSANNDGKLQNVTAAMQYKKSDATIWTDGTGSEITDLVNGTYYVRTKASGTALSSDHVSVTIAASGATALTGTVTISGTPKYGETLTAAVVGSNNSGTLSYQWKRGTTNIGTNSDTYTLVEADIGNTITLTVTSSVETGELTSIATGTIEKADGPAAPVGLTGVAPTTSGGADGKIQNTVATMEYSKTTDFATKTDCAATETTVGVAGTYYVRVKETTTHNAGAYATVEVPAYVAPVYSIELDVTGTYTFTAATAGYGAQTAKTVTVNNTGTVATGDLTVNLSGTNASDFTLSKSSISSLAVSGSDTFTVVPKTGLAAGTYTATVTVDGSSVTAQSFNVSFKVNAVSSGGGGYLPPAQKPTIEAGEGVKVTLSSDGTVATITVDPAYELADVVLNGTSKGKVTEVKGLKTGDKLAVTAAKKAAEPTEPTTEEILATLADQKLVARSKVVTMKNGKKAVRITWYNANGEMMEFDGVEIFRSVKRNSGYGKKPIFTSVTGKYYNTAITEGTRYYYRVRGFVVIDGQKYYTDYSLKAIRTAK